VAAAVPIYGCYDRFSTKGEGPPEFVWLLEKLVVKPKFAAHRDAYVVRRCRNPALPTPNCHTRKMPSISTYLNP